MGKKLWKNLPRLVRQGVAVSTKTCCECRRMLMPGRHQKLYPSCHRGLARRKRRRRRKRRKRSQRKERMVSIQKEGLQTAKRRRRNISIRKRKKRSIQKEGLQTAKRRR